MLVVLPVFPALNVFQANARMANVPIAHPIVPINVRMSPMVVVGDALIQQDV